MPKDSLPRMQRFRLVGHRLDEEANNKGGPRISRTDSPVSAWVIPTDEELMIARHTYSLMDPLKTSLT